MLQPTQPRPEDVARAILADADQAAAALGLTTAPQWEYDGVTLTGYIPVGPDAGLALDAWRRALPARHTIESYSVMTVHGPARVCAVSITVGEVPVRLAALTQARALPAAARRELVTV
jgi:hypothetical protein